jgi:hypothetical protein
MRLKSFFKWANSTLVGHIAYYGSLLAASEAATSIYLNIKQRTLTLSLAIFTVLGCAVIGVLCAVAIWFAVTLPRIKSREKNRRR